MVIFNSYVKLPEGTPNLNLKVEHDNIMIINTQKGGRVLISELFDTSNRESFLSHLQAATLSPSWLVIMTPNKIAIG